VKSYGGPERPREQDSQYLRSRPYLTKDAICYSDSSKSLVQRHRPTQFRPQSLLRTLAKRLRSQKTIVLSRHLNL
jgi:hypothetical protein